jgi:hypothetical protein
MDTKQFESLMNEIEQELKDEDIPIPARPMRAMGVAARKLKITIPVLPWEGYNLSVFTNENMSAHIENWYQHKYGNLLKIDFSPASYIVEIKDDPYELKLPRIMGKARIIADRDLMKEYTKISSDPNDLPCCNILKCIIGISPVIAYQLTDEEIVLLMSEFMQNHISINVLENNINTYEYFPEGFFDYKEATRLIIDQKANYGLSKWESLQFIEKLLKGVLKKNSIPFGYTHRIDELNEIAKVKLGIPVDNNIINSIICTPDVRYNKMLVNKTDAINAHKNTLKALSIIIRYLR